MKVEFWLYESDYTYLSKKIFLSFSPGIIQEVLKPVAMKNIASVY